MLQMDRIRGTVPSKCFGHVPAGVVTMLDTMQSKQNWSCSFLLSKNLDAAQYREFGLSGAMY